MSDKSTVEKLLIKAGRSIYLVNALRLKVAAKVGGKKLK